jgi:hypothetical protein
MAIQSSQAGEMTRLVRGYGIFHSLPRLVTPRMQLVPSASTAHPNSSQLPVPPPCVTQLPSPSLIVIPPAVSAASPPHPSQGILATNTSGIACLVYYLYGAAQAVALAAQAAGAPFDPRSLDLPSIGALVGFYHACLGFPVKQTWLDTIKASNCNTFEGLTYSNAARYCPDINETIMCHLAQQCQDVRSRKPKLALPAPLEV